MASQGFRHAWVTFAFALSASLPKQSQAALNIGLEAADDMIAQMRRSIFIETKYLEERQIEKCSSLDGPSCLTFMGGKGHKSPYQPSSASDGPGVLPERLLHEFGTVGGNSNFTTPEFFAFQQALLQVQKTMVSKSSPKMLAGSRDVAEFRAADANAEHGILHFAGTGLDSRIPLTFSQGMPHRVVATWDGKWMARSCVSHSEKLQLPLGDTKQLAQQTSNRANAITVRHAPTLASSTSGDHVVSTVAQLAGNLGYLRFSQPVVIRSMYTRWQPSKEAVPAVIGGRLGLKHVWTSHMNPEQIRQTRGWQNFGVDSLQPVDEIVFLAASGLEIGAIDIMAFGSNNLDFTERPAVVLSPLDPKTVVDQVDHGNGPKFQLRGQMITPLTAPFIMSLQEVIDKNLLLRLPKPLQPDDKQDTQEVSVESEMDVMKRGLAWNLVSATNQEMFDHRFISNLWGAVPGASLLKGDSQLLQTKVKDFALGLMRSSGNVPSDIRMSLKRESEDIWKALVGFLADGSWRDTIQKANESQDSEDELAKYMTAKKWQASLDLLTAAFLHSHAPELRKRAEQMALQVLSNHPSTHAQVSSRA